VFVVSYDYPIYSFWLKLKYYHLVKQVLSSCSEFGSTMATPMLGKDWLAPLESGFTLPFSAERTSERIVADT
jgi:hypothetical protein